MNHYILDFYIIVRNLCAYEYMFEFERFGRTGRSWHSSGIWTLSPARRSSFLICWLPGKNQLASTAWHFSFRFGSFRTSVTSDAWCILWNWIPLPNTAKLRPRISTRVVQLISRSSWSFVKLSITSKKVMFLRPNLDKTLLFFTENVWRFWPWAKERMHSIAKQCQGQCKACKAFCTASTLCTVFVCCHVARQLICWWWRERPDWLLNNYLVRCAAFRWEGLNIQGLTIHKAQLRL